MASSMRDSSTRMPPTYPQKSRAGVAPRETKEERRWHYQKYGTYQLLSVDDEGVNHDVVEAMVMGAGYEVRHR